MYENFHRFETVRAVPINIYGIDIGSLGVDAIKLHFFLGFHTLIHIESKYVTNVTPASIISSGNFSFFSLVVSFVFQPIPYVWQFYELCIPNICTRNRSVVPIPQIDPSFDLFNGYLRWKNGCKIYFHHFSINIFVMSIHRLSISCMWNRYLDSRLDILCGEVVFCQYFMFVAFDLRWCCIYSHKLHTF